MNDRPRWWEVALVAVAVLAVALLGSTDTGPSAPPSGSAMSAER